MKEISGCGNGWGVDQQPSIVRARFEDTSPAQALSMSNAAAATLGWRTGAPIC